MAEGRRITRREQHRKEQRKKKRLLRTLILVIFSLAVALAAGVLIYRYAPTTERMGLNEFFELTGENEAAVILDTEYVKTPEGEAPYGIMEGSDPYLSITYLKANLDSGYVYDGVENILRYVTDKNVITAYLGSPDYFVDKDPASVTVPVVLVENNEAYVALEFVKLFTDINYEAITEEVNRIVIETAGAEKQVAYIGRNTELRRYGGVKSRILSDIAKGTKVTIKENYGKWSFVLSEDGVLGCVRNNRLKDKSTETVAANLPERTYNHLKHEGTINMAWHQVTNTTANENLPEVLANTSGLNVISPTWFYMNDNAGGIANLASTDYVNTCHANGIQVWALFSNLEAEVDDTSVLNTTSARDNLVNNLIANALLYNLDGINVDIEALHSSAADGYIEFIKELSLKCEANNLYLSVDNYVPSEYTMFYDRATQAKYADYVVIMGYDEYNGNSETPGPTASIGYVRDGVANTMAEVPADQIILGMPFYTRLWSTSDAGLDVSAIPMKAIPSLLETYEVSPQWLDDQGLYYAEYQDELEYMQIWIENSETLELKLQEMKNKGLAGMSFWKLGFETPEIWNTVAKYIY